jgi:hypothetical protein
LAEKVVTTQAGKDFNAGTNVYLVSDSDATVTMFGPVTSYSGTTLTFTPTVIGTASAKTDWTISGRSGARGATGATGTVDLTASYAWTGTHTHTNSMLKLLGSSTGATTFSSANASATNYTITVPAVTATLATTADIPTASAGATIYTANLFGAL